MRPTPYFDEGYYAYYQGVSWMDCPYKDCNTNTQNLIKRIAWMSGFDMAHKECNDLSD